MIYASFPSPVYSATTGSIDIFDINDTITSVTHIEVEGQETFLAYSGLELDPGDALRNTKTIQLSTKNETS
jgi:hypothetical protein